jgi:hypothetical protein
VIINNQDFDFVLKNNKITSINKKKKKMIAMQNRKDKTKI